MLNIGMRLADRYEIVKVLGGGGMAVVYQARDLVLDRWVAIKVMNDSLQDNHEFIQRFIREAKATGSLSHPNVVNVYDIGREGSIYYMVMEYISGMTLAEYVQKKGSLLADEVMEITMQICDGLSTAHRNGIIHRDIKAHNILRTEDGRYKVTDFGISYFSKTSTSLTQTGTVMGSAHYFSPEQASGGKVTYASDLYSVGILMFYLLTGRFPFDGDNSVSIAMKHIQEEVPDPRQWNSAIPNQLCQVIQKALAKDPAQRYQTADEMKRVIQRIQASERKKTRTKPTYRYTEHATTETASLPSRHTKHRRKDKKKKHRTFWFILGLAILGVLISFFIYYFVWADRSDQQPVSDPSKTTTKKPTPKPKPSTPQKPSRTDLKGDHPWWKELPNPELTENEIFKNFQVNGEDGEYDVSLLVGKIPEKSFFYNIYVVDRFSSRLILSGRSVAISPSEEEFTEKTFHVSIPEPLLPTTGLLKIEIYRKTDQDEKVDATDNVLQQWGEPPKDKEDD